MKEINRNMQQEMMESESLKRQRLVTSVLKLAALRETTESSGRSRASLTFEETMMKNVPHLGFIVDGDLKEGRRTPKAVTTRIDDLPPASVAQAQDRINITLGVGRAITRVDTARRLAAYLPIVIPETEEAYKTFNSIARVYGETLPLPAPDEIGDVQRLEEILNQLDKETIVSARGNNQTMTEVTNQARLLAQQKKQESTTDQLAKYRSSVAERKISLMRDEALEQPLVIGNNIANSTYQVALFKIGEDEEIKTKTAEMEEKAAEKYNAAATKTLQKLATDRAIQHIKDEISDNSLLREAAARLLAMQPEELVVAPEEIKEKAAKRLAEKPGRLILSRELGKTFSGTERIQAKRVALEEGMPEVLSLKTGLSEQECEIVERMIPKITAKTMREDLAKAILRQQVEMEVTKDEIIDYATEGITSELLSARLSFAVDLAVKDLGIDQAGALKTPATLVQKPSDIINLASRYIAQDIQDLKERLAIPTSYTNTYKRERKAIFRRLQYEVVNPNTQDPMIVGNSEIVIFNPLEKGATRVYEVIQRLTQLGILQDTQQMADTIPGHDTKAIKHETNSTVYVNLSLKDEGKQFVHARVVSQKQNGKYRDTNAAAIPDTENVNIISGLCLFSGPAVTVVDVNGEVYSLTNPYLNGSVEAPLVSIAIDQKLQPYEADSLYRISRMLNTLNPDKVGTLALAVPKLEYYLYAMDTYEKGFISAELMQEWFSAVDRRAEGITNLMQARIHDALPVAPIMPLASIETQLKNAVATNRRGILPQLLATLRQDPLWKKVLEVEAASGNPITNYNELNYLSYTVGYLQMIGLNETKMLIAVENTEEAGILNRARSILGEITDNATIVGIYAHTNVIMNEESTVDNKRTLYFYDQKQQHIRSLVEIAKANK